MVTLAGLKIGGDVVDVLGRFKVVGGGPAKAGMGMGASLPLGTHEPSNRLTLDDIQANRRSAPLGKPLPGMPGVRVISKGDPGYDAALKRAQQHPYNPGTPAEMWGRFKQTVFSPKAIFGAGVEQVPQNLFDLMAGLGKDVRGQVGAGIGAAAGNIPDRFKNLWSGFQGQAQEAWNSGGLDAFRKRQAENTARIQGELTRALAPPPPPPGSDLAPGHAMSAASRGGAVVADVTSPLTSSRDAKKREREFEQLLSARQSAYDALVANARALAEAAPEGHKAQTEAAVVLPALASQLGELRGQAQALLPKARASAEGARDYWNTVKQGWSLQEQMQQLQNRSQQEQAAAVEKAKQKAKEALEVRKKAFGDRGQAADLITQLHEARLRNTPGLNDRQRQQALVPALLQQYFHANQAAPGENANERLTRELSGEQVKGRALEAAGIMRDGRLITGQGRARLAFAQLDEIARQAAGQPFAEAAAESGMAAITSGRIPSAAVASAPVTNNFQIELNVGAGATREDFRAAGDRAYEEYMSNRRREQTESGSLAPSKGFYRR